MIDVIVSPEARDDIDEITDYSFRTFGVEIAMDYMAGITKVFERLADYPGLGAIMPKIRPPVHGFTYRSHQIIYDFDGHRVVIVRILHHAMNVAGALKQ